MEGEGEGDGASSWETESEHSVDPAEEAAGDDANASPSVIRPKLADTIEKARVAMTRLEEASRDNPKAHGCMVMKQFLEVYRDCRHLDRLMGTSYFHEGNFEGMLEKVKDRSRISSTQKMVSEQVNMLFAEGTSLKLLLTFFSDLSRNLLSYPQTPSLSPRGQ